MAVDKKDETVSISYKYVDDNGEQREEEVVVKKSDTYGQMLIRMLVDKEYRDGIYKQYEGIQEVLDQEREMDEKDQEDK